MPASGQASVACVALAALAAVGCWEATKVVGLGEVCATRGFDGDVVCEQGLACLVRDATLWSANGLATGAAIAGDLVRLGNTMAVYAELRVLALITGRFSTTNGALAIGFRWR